MLDFGVPPLLAWDLTLRHLAALGERARAQERAADHRAGLLVAMFYNAHRDTKRDPGGATWLDFFPHWRESQTDAEMFAAMMLWTRVTARS